MTHFWIHSAWNHSLYLYLIYELQLCKILCQYINKCGYYKYFPIYRDFSHIFYHFTPQNGKFWNYSASQCFINIFRFLLIIERKNDIFAPKSPKLVNIRKKFCLKPMTTNHTKYKIKMFSKCSWVEISALIGHIWALSKQLFSCFV